MELMQAMITEVWALLIRPFEIFGFSFTFFGLTVFVAIASGILWLLTEVMS